MCVGGALFGGENWRSREIVGACNEVEGLWAAVEKCVCCLPRTVTRVLALFSNVWRTIRLQAICPPHIREKETWYGSGKWHTYFATEAQSDGTQWNTPQFHLAMQWLVLATEQCTAGAAW